MESFYLLALTAPQHITIRIRSVRDSIFRETGAVSALAFDPLIPVAFYSSPPDKKHFTGITTPAAHFQLLSPEIHEKGIYFRVNSEQIFDTLKCITAAEEQPRHIIEPFSGFFLCESTDPKTREIITEIAASKIKTGNLAWTGITLQMIEVICRGSQSWFNNLDWTIMWEIILG